MERTVQKAKDILKALTFGKPTDTWDRYIYQMLFQLRMRKNAAMNKSPSYAVLGYELAQSGDWEMYAYRQERRRDAEVAPETRQEDILTNSNKYKQGYAPAEAVTPVVYKVGDLVMVKRLRKVPNVFLPSWTGPHKIVKKLSDEVYIIKKGNKDTTLHVDNIRLAPEDNQVPLASDDEDSPDEDDPIMPSGPRRPNFEEILSAEEGETNPTEGISEANPNSNVSNTNSEDESAPPVEAGTSIQVQAEVYNRPNPIEIPPVPIIQSGHFEVEVGTVVAEGPVTGIWVRVPRKDMEILIKQGRRELSVVLQNCQPEIDRLSRSGHI